MLPHTQGGALPPRHRRLPRLGDRRSTRAVRRALAADPRGVGRRIWALQGKSTPRVDGGGGVGIHPRPRPAVQSPARPAVPEHRLLALHARHPAGRGPARGSLVVGTGGIARMRTASKTAGSAGRGPGELGPKMDYLPVFLRVEGRRVVVVGGGEVALRKAQWLLKAGARVTLIAPELRPDFARFAPDAALSHTRAPFEAAHLAGAVAVVAATDDREVNAAVSAAAQAGAIPVNVVDDAALSTFIFPAIIDRSPLIVAVSSAGYAPVLARGVREQIEALLPQRLGALA